MADKYQITIALDDETLKDLKITRDHLHGYKGVKSSIGGGKSTVWFTTNDFSKEVKIEWTEEYSGYVEDIKELKGGVSIDSSNTKSMDLGDKLTVNDDGTTSLSTDGQEGDITIFNSGERQWVCGIAQKVNVNNEKPSIMCAFNLFGHHSDLMMPYEEILLMFESEQKDTGTVVEESVSEAIIITLTGDERIREVSYHINKGWDAKHAKWAKIEKNTFKLADKLIHQM